MSIKDERIVYSSRLKYFKSLANSQNVIEKLDLIYLFILLFKADSLQITAICQLCC